MPKFTKQHYIVIANILHNFYPVKQSLESLDGFNIRNRQFTSLVTTFANHFKLDNFQFDIDKFERAVYDNDKEE